MIYFVLRTLTRGLSTTTRGRQRLVVHLRMGLGLPKGWREAGGCEGENLWLILRHNGYEGNLSLSSHYLILFWIIVSFDCWSTWVQGLLFWIADIFIYIRHYILILFLKVEFRNWFCQTRLLSCWTCDGNSQVVLARKDLALKHILQENVSFSWKLLIWIVTYESVEF